ncbi:uncharacterized protein LOC123525364 isoform X2 [Mercenaria mercenaria]|uniref:uncharacterized protein LOC123525364 isoform X2 n=1 Tax=Mercenaria mercenaria TaxID=6596 RepID=UPI00234E5F41|nr:uncharacterized protein LOC123525364 isoform X2 [Mercenaria mercenaria]
MRAIYTVTVWLACTVSCSAVLDFFTMFAKESQEADVSLYPMDPTVCVSSDITFSCNSSLHRKSDSADQIRFFKGKNSFKSVKNLNRNGKNTANFTLYEVSEVDQHLIVCCTLGNSCNTSEAVVSMLNVLPMPEKVEHVDCIVENYIKSMRCSWSYGDNYKGRELPHVEFHWRIPEYSRSWNVCSDLNIKAGYCNWNSSRSGDFTMKLIDIKLMLKEPCGVNVSSNFTIDTRKIVKPNPVFGLKSSVLNSTCVQVQWRTNNSEMQYPKEHKLIVSSKWDDPKVYKFNTTEDTEKDTHGWTLCSLHPHTAYTFTVSIQPTGGQAGFYSDPREIVATTYSDIPSASPGVTEGGYSWTHRDCEGINDKRKVCVFWKPIPEEDKNGQMKGLDVVFTAVNQASKPINNQWAEDSTYGCSLGLLCNIDYVFSIKARNRNGTSEDNSTLLISAVTKGIVQPQFIVEAANTSNVSVSWTEAEKATGYVVAWCRNRNGECENRNIVNWQRFSSATRKAVLQINPENSPQDFLYGVSVLTEQGSSGVEWQDCVYLKNAKPSRKPQNVVVSTGPDDNTLVVTWDKLTCKSDEPYIAMYSVQFYKEHGGNQQSQNVSASGEARVVLNNLEEEQTYIVTVRGITKDGHYGQESQQQKGVPVDKSLKPDAIVGISISVPIVVILAVVGCFCVLRMCKRKADKTKESLAQITIPDDTPFGPDGTVEEGGIDRSSTRSINSIERQNSNDSGFDPMTPPVGKFDKQPKFVNVSGLKNPQVLPNGYCTAEFEKGQSSDIDPGSPAVELGSLHTSLDNLHFVPTEPVVAQVGFVMNGNYGTGSETFVKKVDRDTVLNETAVKARVKNDSGDSGVSDAYSKAALGRSGEKMNNDNGQDVDEKNANNDNEIPDYVSGDKVINSSFKTSSIIIPTTLAFSECSFDNSSFSDRENDITNSHVSDTCVGSSPDYVKAQSPHDNVNALLSPEYITAQSHTVSTNIKADNHQVSLPKHKIQNKSNEDNESIPEKVFANVSFQPLTNIPCPRSMDESDDSSIEEETVSSPTHADASSAPVKPQSGTSKSDYIKVTNNSTPMIHIPSNSSKSLSQPVNEHGQASDYVTTTDMPSMSIKCAPQQQENSGTSYVTLPNTGMPVSERTHGIPVQMLCVNPHQKPNDAHVSVSESQTSKQNSDVSLGYVTSVTSLNTSNLTQSSLNSSPVSSHTTSNLPSTDSNYFSEDPNVKIPTPASDQTNMTLLSVYSCMSSNVVNDNHAAGGYTSHSAVAQGPVPVSSAPISVTTGGYLPHLNPVQGQMSPGATAAQSAMYSPNVQASCEGERDVAYPNASKTVDSTSSANSGYVLSENNPFPKSTEQTSSGYVTNTDSPATFSSVAAESYDVSPQYRHTTAQKTDSQLKESYTGSDCTDQSLSSESGMVAFNNDQPKENIPDSHTNKTNESQKPNNVPTSEMQLPNGYVDHQFIPKGNVYKEQPSVEMRNIENQNNGDDQGSKRGSDFGLSSLENESPETNRKLKNVQTGYVSCEVAKLTKNDGLHML